VTIAQSASSYIQQRAARILRKRTERKTEDVQVLGEDQFEFGREKGTRDAIGIKFCPRTGCEGPEGEQGYNSTLPLI
jgi:hypothetical protein